MKLDRLFFTLYLLSITCALSLALVPLMKRLAKHFGIVDMPGPRKVHDEPVPLLGGGAIVLSFMLIVMGHYLLFVWLGKYKPGALPFFVSQYPLAVALWPKLGLILATASVIFSLGLMDDMIGVNFDYRLKFAIQFIMAGVIVLHDINIGVFPYPWLNNIITVLWIVGITNSFNLLDNMNGLSSGVAILVTAIFLVVAFQQGQFFITLVLAVFLGAVLGFYPYNFPRSSIFLGDGGSLFIGYILGVLTVAESYVTAYSQSLFPVIMPVLVLSVPIFDTLSVMYIRYKEKRPLFVGDNCHLSHRLVTLGMNKSQAVLCIYLFTLVLGINSILLERLTNYGSIIVLVQGLLIITIISVLMLIGTQRRGKSE